MPTDLYKYDATWSATPQDGGLLKSGAVPVGPTRVSSQVVLDQKHLDTLTLSSDAPLAVNFGAVANAHVIDMTCDRKIKVRLTSADGAQQVIDVDGELHLVSKSAPYTALDLIRLPATTTNVVVFLGEKA